MKKKKLIALALLGMSMGLILTGYAQEPMSPEMQAFYRQLKPEAQKRFLELDTDHKKAAMQLSHQGCGDSNHCNYSAEQSVEEEYKIQMQQRAQMNQGLKQ